MVQRGRKCRCVSHPRWPSILPATVRADGEVCEGARSATGVAWSVISWVPQEQTTPSKADSLIPGKYRNKFTDAVELKVRSTANTNVVFFNGQLLALKEDSPPYAMDPVTLETKGLYDFEGQLPSLTFTAHPKFDPVTGEMICFGYEARGDGTPDVCYYTVSPTGQFTEVVWLVSPVVAMIHDFAVTDNWVCEPVP